MRRPRWWTAKGSSFARAFLVGSLYFYLTGAVIEVGVVLGAQFFRPPFDHPRREAYEGDPRSNWDGVYYREIATSGYKFDPKAKSNVASFPLFPLLGSVVNRVTGIGVESSLILVSNLSLLGAFILAARHVETRYGRSEPELVGYVLLAMGLMPTSFYFRMAYSESTFLLLTILVLYGMERGWALPALAAVVGLATAARPVGVALVVPLAVHVLRKPVSLRRRFFLLAVLLPFSCWGVAAYAFYLGRTVGHPLAFAVAHSNWEMRPAGSVLNKAVALAGLEPVLTLFDPHSGGFWANRDPRGSPFLSLHVLDPLIFLAAAALIGVGALKRWLSPTEWVAGAALLGVAYVAHGYECYMYCFGRFSSVAFPLYLVLGRLLLHAPGPVAAWVVSVGGLLAATFAAQFATWYSVY